MQDIAPQTEQLDTMLNNEASLPPAAAALLRKLRTTAEAAAAAAQLESAPVSWHSNQDSAPAYALQTAAVAGVCQEYDPCPHV